MKLRNIKLCILIVFTIILFAPTAGVSAQVRHQQTRGFSDQPEEPQVQMSEENRRALREIEDMRNMIRERREQQEAQRQVLQELQQVISGDDDISSVVAPTPTTSRVSATKEVNKAMTQSSLRNTQERVTSGSQLSKLEAQEREDLQEILSRYERDMEEANNENEMLKKQLAIANRQLDQCQGGGVPSYSTEISQSYNTLPVQQQKMQSVQYKEQNSQFEDEGVQPQMSAESKRALQDIEDMRKMLRDRREQQEAQRKVIQELQEMLE